MPRFTINLNETFNPYLVPLSSTMRQYDTPYLKSDPGRNCDFGSFPMKFELKISWEK